MLLIRRQSIESSTHQTEILFIAMNVSGALCAAVGFVVILLQYEVAGPASIIWFPYLTWQRTSNGGGKSSSSNGRSHSSKLFHSKKARAICWTGQHPSGIRDNPASQEISRVVHELTRAG